MPERRRGAAAARRSPSHPCRAGRTGSRHPGRSRRREQRRDSWWAERTDRLSSHLDKRILCHLGSPAARVRRRGRRPRWLHQRRSGPALSQPSLSHGVRQLEAELGVELFQRLGRTVRPTAAGERVVDAARHVLREAAEVVAVAASCRPRRRHARGGHPADARRRPGRTARRGLPRSHPGVVVRIEEADRAAEPERRSRRTGRARLHRGHHGRTRPGTRRAVPGRDRRGGAARHRSRRRPADPGGPGTPRARRHATRDVDPRGARTRRAPVGAARRRGGGDGVTRRRAAAGARRRGDGADAGTTRRGGGRRRCRGPPPPAAAQSTRRHRAPAPARCRRRPGR